MTATLDGEPVPYWQAFAVKAGQVLKLGGVTGAGTRAYLAVRGGIDVPEVSRQPLHLHARQVRRPWRPRAARRRRAAYRRARRRARRRRRPRRAHCSRDSTHAWEIGVLYGPHGAPDFFTPDDIDTFFAAAWEVHYNSTAPASA